MFKFINDKVTPTFLGLMYFIFNTVLLPPPVTFTTLTSIFWVKKAITVFGKTLFALLLILGLYAMIHNINGVVVLDYFKSSIYFGLLILSGFVTYLYLNSSHINVSRTFEVVSIAALILLFIAVVALLTPFASIFWADHSFIGGGEKMMRYQGLIYEPSHLALTLSPLFLFFLWKKINKLEFKNSFYLIATALPIALTISFGFVAVLLISLIATLLLVAIIYQKFKRVLILPLIAVFVSIVALSLVSENISGRLSNIIQGNDSSVNGRTTEAFTLGYKCAETKSVWFGIGLGQVKHIGEEVIRPYYAAQDPVGYSVENWPIIQIPTNSAAETMAVFGILGLLLKIGFQIFCFIKLKVYDNYLNLSIFFFIFFYQLMGSFILSSTEIIMWAFAFAKIFPEFNVNEKPLNATIHT